MTAPLTAGTRVTAVLYGVRKRGVVLFDRGRGVVWVRWDGSVKPTWAFYGSLRAEDTDMGTPCEGCGKPATVQVAAGQCVMEWCPACHATMLADYANGLCLGCSSLRGTCANGCEPIAPSDFHPINAERAS